MRESEQPTVGPERVCPSCGVAIPTAEEFCRSCSETNAYDAGKEGPPYTGPEEIAGFRIVREVGRGGMGTVYEAEDKKLRRRVALKVLSRRLSSSDKAHLRFEREAWIAGKLNHPNLVKVYERGVWIDVDFYSMEYVDGGSLYDVILNMRKWDRDVSWNLEYGTRDYVTWALTHIAATARALDYAHRQGVIHRDIKPMNILLTVDPCMVKIADFGIALDVEATRMTTTQHPLGTVAYMAPEQIQGETEKIDARCDIYCLGVTLFELLTLELPFAAGTQQLYLNSVLTGQARRPSRLNEMVSRDLDVVLGKALEKEPKDRYASAADFAEDLENILAFKPVSAKPPSAPTKLAKWARRKPMHAALAVALILGVPTVVGLTVRALQQQRALAEVEMENLWEKARLLRQDNRPQEALAPLTDLLARDPNHVKGLHARALSYWEIARKESDGTEKSRLESLALQEASRIVVLMPDASWPYSLRAFLLEECGRGGEAERDRERAQAYRSDPPTTTELRFEGMLALESGDDSKAIEIFSKLLTRDPTRVEARIDRARAHENLGALAKAITDYDVAAGVMPTSFLPPYQLGRLLTEVGELERAAAHYARAVELDPENPHVHAGFALNLLEQGKARAAAGDMEGARVSFASAEREAGEALKLDPDLAWAHLNLGATLMERNRLFDEPDPTLINRAVAEYERVIALWRASGGDPKDEVYATVLINQCDALIQVGEHNRALEICRAAVDVDPDDAVNYYNLAGVYALLGRADEALGALERDFELGDTDWEYLASDAWFEALRDDPRFTALVEGMKAEPAGGSTP